MGAPLVSRALRGRRSAHYIAAATANSKQYGPLKDQHILRTFHALRRTEAAGACYFFTVVTFRRQPVFTQAPVVEMLERAIRRVQERRPFVIEAQVVLPDHLHALWTLPDNDSDYPTRWRLIKEAFTREYVPAYGLIWDDARRSARGERTVWQRRYWEHLIRDDGDFSAHLEYIHLNPVRHGLVKAPRDWPHSTFLKWVANGSYDLTWGSKGPVPLPDWAGWDDRIVRIASNVLGLRFA